MPTLPLLWVALHLLAAPAAPKQNILLITVDTLRGDVLSYAGGAAHTPFFDELASRGWRFDACYAAAMLTNPAHASLMTSLYPRDHGVYDNDHGIQTGEPTLAAQLKAHGYNTAAIINFPHLNPNVANLGQGFTTVQRGSLHERRAQAMTAAGLALIETLKEPWFVWLHYTDPHSPYDPPEASLPKAGDKLPWADEPMDQALRAAPGFQKANPWFKKAFREYPDTQAMTSRYVGEVANTDRALADLWDGLVQRGFAKDTIWALTSDHGENMGEHALYFHHGGLYRPTVHVPLIIYATGEKPRIMPGLVQSVDIAPTLLDLVQVPLFKPMRGRSLLPYARAQGEPDEFAFSEHMLGQMASVRGKDGTLIVHRRRSRQFPTYPMTPGTQEFFGPDDIGEAHPSHEAPASLARALRKFLHAPKPHYKPRQAPADNRAALRALGYVE